MSKQRAVFLDRDGVINRTFFHDGKLRAPDRLDQFEFLPGVKTAVEQLKNAGFLTIVVTNQPDVARGWQKKEVVDSMNDKVMQELRLHDLKVCFHDDEARCACRKPKAGMLLEAAKDWEIDLNASYMVGDRYSDIQAGNLAGCSSILVRDGNFVGARGLPNDKSVPRTEVGSLKEAVDWILKKEKELANSPVFR
jgi:D-glycero-D-manno-heptose 1,7-bisphosphate phosphatase